MQSSPNVTCGAHVFLGTSIDAVVGYDRPLRTGCLSPAAQGAHARSQRCHLVNTVVIRCSVSHAEQQYYSLEGYNAYKGKTLRPFVVQSLPGHGPEMQATSQCLHIVNAFSFVTEGCHAHTT